MIRAKAKKLAIIFAVLMFVVFLATDWASTTYAKVTSPNQTVSTVILIVNIVSFMWLFIGLVLVFFIQRGRFHFQDDPPRGTPSGVPTPPRAPEQRGGFGLGNAFRPKPPSPPSSGGYSQNLPQLCENCGHKLLEKPIERGFNNRGQKVVEMRLDHETSYPDLRTNITYCSISLNGRVCGCEHPTAPKPKNCVNCGHLLDPSNTRHYEEHPDLRSGIAYCRASMPNGLACGCESIYPQGGYRQASNANLKEAQPVPKQSYVPIPDARVNYKDGAGTPQADKPRSQHDELVETLTLDIQGLKSKEDEEDEDVNKSKVGRPKEEDVAPETTATSDELEPEQESSTEVSSSRNPEPVEQRLSNEVSLEEANIPQPRRGRGRPKGSYGKRNEKPKPSRAPPRPKPVEKALTEGQNLEQSPKASAKPAQEEALEEGEPSPPQEGSGGARIAGL